jgi:uncharacterized membrane protein
MVIMALDHTRDFVHAAAFDFNPTDLTQTTPAIFLTRWITHYCAPIFVFLAGTSAYLQLARGMSRRDLARYLLTRGLWLVVLEFTVLRVLIWFNVDFSFLGIVQVIWVLGVSMIVLAGLIWMPLPAIAVFGLGMIGLHNLLDGIQLPAWQPGGPAPDVLTKAWFFLHQPNQLFPLFTASGPTLFVVYPLIPWIGVMAAGYVFGKLYARAESGRQGPWSRRRVLLALGLALTAAFVVIRAINVYGDPSRWAPQSSAVFTLLSFVNTTKYPPSLLFLLMTLGPAILVLGALDGRAIVNPIGRALLTFGRVPLFFYLLQWAAAHSFAIVLNVAAGKEIGYLFESLIEFYATAPPDAGFSLGVTYIVWAIVVAVLFVLCRWYAGVKSRSSSVLLRYL